MYQSFIPEQMGLRASRVWKRDGDNHYVFPPKRTRVLSSKAIRRDAKGNIIGAVCAVRPSGKTAVTKAERVTAKRTVLRAEHEFGRVCRCAVCKLSAKRSVGTVEHSTKDHL